MTNLDLFFDTMRGFLLGHIDVQAVEATLGMSPSGVRKLGFYRTLVRNDHHGFMEKLYGFTQQVLRERFSDVCDRYLSDYPPDHWEPNQTGERFPSWLRENTESLELAPWLADLAQYEWFEFVVYTDPTSNFGKVSGLHVNPTMRALIFDYDVAGWINRGQASTGDVPGPDQRSTILLIYRDPHSQQCRFLEATPWTQLIVTAVEDGTDPIQAAVSAGGDAQTAEIALTMLLQMNLLYHN